MMFDDWRVIYDIAIVTIVQVGGKEMGRLFGPTESISVDYFGPYPPSSPENQAANSLDQPTIHETWKNHGKTESICAGTKYSQ